MGVQSNGVPINIDVEIPRELVAEVIEASEEDGAQGEDNGS